MELKLLLKKKRKQRFSALTSFEQKKEVKEASNQRQRTALHALQKQLSRGVEARIAVWLAIKQCLEDIIYVTL